MPVDQRLVSKLSVYLIHGLFLMKSSFTCSQISLIILRCLLEKKKKKKCSERDSGFWTHVHKVSVLGQSWRAAACR